VKFQTDDSINNTYSTVVITDLKDRFTGPTTWTERITYVILEPPRLRTILPLIDPFVCV
jgi:hypothetical protein